MFVTMPQFEQPLMSSLAEGGQQYWRAVVAAFPAQPWYVFSYCDKVIDRRVQLAQLVAWEETLLGIIDLVPLSDRRAVYRVDSSVDGDLLLRKVAALWSPHASEAGAGTRAVLAFESSDELVDEHLRPVSPHLPRRLVFSSDGTAPAQGALQAH